MNKTSSWFFWTLRRTSPSKETQKRQVTSWWQYSRLCKVSVNTVQGWRLILPGGLSTQLFIKALELRIVEWGGSLPSSQEGNSRQKTSTRYWRPWKGSGTNPWTLSKVQCSLVNGFWILVSKWVWWKILSGFSALEDDHLTSQPQTPPTPRTLLAKTSCSLRFGQEILLPLLFYFVFIWLCWILVTAWGSHALTRDRTRALRTGSIGLSHWTTWEV